MAGVVFLGLGSGLGSGRLVARRSQEVGLWVAMFWEGGSLFGGGS